MGVKRVPIVSFIMSDAIVIKNVKITLFPRFFIQNDLIFVIMDIEIG